MWQSFNLSEVKQKLNTNFQYGLTNEEVIVREKKYGKNKLEDTKSDSVVLKFIKQFNDFMIITLIIASVVSAVVSKINNSNDYLESIIIIVIVVFNAILGVIQETKAEKSIEALKKMISPIVKVRREGRVREVQSEDLVPGDIVILEAGNIVPADCRLINAVNLQVEESSLTGENVPVIKDANVILKDRVGLGDCINMIFSTTVVVNGHAEAVVTDIGMNTKVGKIAKMIITNESPETPLQRKLSEVGKSLGIVCLGICFLIFFIGIIKRIAPIEMFMTAVGLAVAAIPEGLPAIVTIVLSLGVTKMARKNSIIRKLPAVETLGSSSVICSDKTGTLTQNKMKIVQVITPNNNLVDYKSLRATMNSTYLKNENTDLAIELATMCTDVDVSVENGVTKMMGDPTEIAIVDECYKNGKSKKLLYSQYERVNDIPFDSKRKMMTTIHKVGNRYRVITKGAPDVLLKRCSKFFGANQIYSLNTSDIKTIEKQNEMLALKALRVIAVAYKDIDYMPSKIDSDYMENDLIFVGLIGMMDPPREGVKEAISVCKRAGIKPVMITGDHIITANAIASELGILKPNDLSITESELSRLSDKELEENIMKYSVFARVSPESKSRIVSAFQNRNEVVAMTGDGVNDAPALKKANIGIAMGLNGTDVAKSAADMVLADDNFVTIVEAVKQGRNIFNNIKKAIHFLISTNIGEIITVFVGLLIGMKSPLTAIQLLWINLITDSLPAIALGLEEPDESIMKEKPRSIKKSVFSDGLWSKMILEGVLIGIFNLFAYSIGRLYSLETARTMAFVSLGLLELMHIFTVRSGEALVKGGVFKNKYLIIAFVVGFILQIAVVVIPGFDFIFKVKNLNIKQWIITIIISLMPTLLIEIQKLMNEIRFGKVLKKSNA